MWDLIPSNAITHISFLQVTEYYLDDNLLGPKYFAKVKITRDSLCQRIVFYLLPNDVSLSSASGQMCKS